MNNDLFNQARGLYQAGDYQGALGLFTQCVQGGAAALGAGEVGMLYHQIGNCLIKLNNPGEAIHAYTQATADNAYDACGSLNCNLGMAYAALHDYNNAVRHFEIAVADAKYETPYKAYIGMGNALMKLGKSAEAGVAFREGALDEANPDPTRALLNLGVCFMALNRPRDAVSSYESALQFDMKPDMSNKLHANLGQAYAASGQMQKAVNAFEEALADGTYYLSDSASVDYQRAIASISQGTAELTQIIPAAADMSGLDVTATGEPVAAYLENEQPYYAQESAYYEDDPYYYPDATDAQEVGGYATPDERFFNASDEELEKWSKGLAKRERKRKNVGLKILLVLVILLLLAAAGAVYAYTQGYGYPTQETVVKEFFADPESAKDTLISADVDSDTVDTMLNLMVTDSDVTIDGINKTMSDSIVYVSADTGQGGEVQYKVGLVRDMITWKVASVELYFPSQN